MTTNNKNKSAKPNVRVEIRKRVFWLYVIFCFFSVLIIAQLLLIQFGPNSRGLRNVFADRFYRVDNVEAQRGNVLAADGKILMTGSPYYDTKINFAWMLANKPEVLNDSVFYRVHLQRTADTLATMLGGQSSYYRQRLIDIYKNARRKGPNCFQTPFLNNLEKGEADAVAGASLFKAVPGSLITERKQGRFNPYGMLNYILGGEATLGIERYYGDVLAGKDGVSKKVRLSPKVWVPVDDPVNEDVVNGLDVVTTIDVDWQDVVENELRKQLSTAGARFGTAAVMEVSTGELKALAVVDNSGEFALGYSDNRFTSFSVDPGSTFKLASLLALLEKGGCSLDTEVDCSYKGQYAQVGNARVRDSHKIDATTLRGAMAASSNVGFARAVHTAFEGRDSVYCDYIKGLGLNKVNGLQRNRGAAPTFLDPRTYKRWYRDGVLEQMAYGYSLSLTPMHTLMLYNAVANGGKMITPVLVKEYREGDHVVERFKTEVVNAHICSDKTLLQAREALLAVVEEGTGKLLRNPHFAVAGKTGTAQMLQTNANGKKVYMLPDGSREYLATFVGYFPADHPLYTCIVAIDTRNNNMYYGGSLAGPVFSKITGKLYSLQSDMRQMVPVKGQKIDSVKVKGGSMEQLRKAAVRLGIDNDISRRERGFAKAECNESLSVNEIEEQRGVMPSVVGLGLRDAVYVLERRGLRVVFNGKGGVVSQSIAAGRPISAGQSVELQLR